MSLPLVEVEGLCKSFLVPTSRRQVTTFGDRSAMPKRARPSRWTGSSRPLLTV